MPAWETTRESKMTGIDPERLERRLRWAAEQLGLRPDASPEEVRAAWLRRLPAEDFVPSSELCWSLATLLRRQREGEWEARADEAATVAEEERLRVEVEAFAIEFWNLSVEERRRRWEALRDRCAFAPALRARLRLLEAGLGVASGEQAGEDTCVVELARLVRELFFLRPGPRALARQNLVRRLQNDRAWKVAARRLRYVNPTLAALGNDLLDKLLSETPRLVHLEYADNRRERTRQPTAAKSGSSGCGWSTWAIVVIAMGILRLFATVFKEDSSSHPPPSIDVPPRLLQPQRGKKPPPDVWESVFEKQRIQDEEFKKELRIILEEKSKDWNTKKKGDEGDKRDKKPHERTPFTR